MRKTTARIVQGIRKLVREWWSIIFLALLTAIATYVAKVTEEPAAISLMGYYWGLLSAAWAVTIMVKWK
ncbi:MAG TPA: hypothetical protein VM537_04470 [Anaerolineae bacterium]|nr:hypothetical protein [Anaerolineae bacterium]